MAIGTGTFRAPRPKKGTSKDEMVPSLLQGGHQRQAELSHVWGECVAVEDVREEVFKLMMYGLIR